MYLSYSVYNALSAIHPQDSSTSSSSASSSKPVVKAAKPKAKVAVKSKAKAKAQAGARRGTPVEEVHGKAASAMKKSLVDWYNTNRTHSRDYHNTELYYPMYIEDYQKPLKIAWWIGIQNWCLNGIWTSILEGL